MMCLNRGVMYLSLANFTWDRSSREWLIVLDNVQRDLRQHLAFQIVGVMQGAASLQWCKRLLVCIAQCWYAWDAQTELCPIVITLLNSYAKCAIHAWTSSPFLPCRAMSNSMHAFKCLSLVKPVPVWANGHHVDSALYHCKCRFQTALKPWTRSMLMLSIQCTQESDAWNFPAQALAHLHGHQWK